MLEIIVNISEERRLPYCASSQEYNVEETYGKPVKEELI